MLGPRSGPGSTLDMEPLSLAVSLRIASFLRARELRALIRFLSFILSASSSSISPFFILSFSRCLYFLFASRCLSDVFGVVELLRVFTIAEIPSVSTSIASPA